MQKLGEILLQQRKAKGLKLKDLSEKSGISTVSIKCYEIGLKYPSANILGKLAEALELDYNLLYDILTNEKNSCKE